MQVNTAVAFVLLGAGMFGRTRASETHLHRLALVPVCAALVLAALVGSQYLTGRDLGIDQWLFRELPGQIGTVQPNRMSPMTVICFLLIGCSVVLAGRRWADRFVPVGCQ